MGNQCCNDEDGANYSSNPTPLDAPLAQRWDDRTDLYELYPADDGSTPSLSPHRDHLAPSSDPQLIAHSPASPAAMMSYEDTVAYHETTPHDMCSLNEGVVFDPPAMLTAWVPMDQENHKFLSRHATGPSLPSSPVGADPENEDLIELLHSRRLTAWGDDELEAEPEELFIAHKPPSRRQTAEEDVLRLLAEAVAERAEAAAEAAEAEAVEVAAAEVAEVEAAVVAAAAEAEAAEVAAAVEAAAAEAEVAEVVAAEAAEVAVADAVVAEGAAAEGVAASETVAVATTEAAAAAAEDAAAAAAEDAVDGAIAEDAADGEIAEEPAVTQEEKRRLATISDKRKEVMMLAEDHVSAASNMLKCFLKPLLMLIEVGTATEASIGALIGRCSFNHTPVLWDKEQLDPDGARHCLCVLQLKFTLFPCLPHYLYSLVCCL